MQWIRFWFGKIHGTPVRFSSGSVLGPRHSCSFSGLSQAGRQRKQGPPQSVCSRSHFPCVHIRHRVRCGHISCSDLRTALLMFFICREHTVWVFVPSLSALIWSCMKGRPKHGLGPVWVGASGAPVGPFTITFWWGGSGWSNFGLRFLTQNIACPGVGYPWTPVKVEPLP